jgi:hypothetical protein
MKKYFLYSFLNVAVGVLLALFVIPLNNKETIEVVEKRVTDTLFFVKHDTITIEKPIYINKKVIDTVYISTYGKDSISIPISSYFYHKDNVYDIWISGYQSNLDSIKVYQKTEYIRTKEFVNTVEKVEMRSFYILGGFKSFFSNKRPNVGFIYKTRRNTLFSIDFGIDKNNEYYYGMSVGLKIK